MINVEDHLGLARKIASQYYNYSKDKYSYDEIESTAFVGLLKAAQRFDESKGFKFSTYAFPMIIGEIKRMFRDDKWYFLKRGVPMKMLSTNYIIDDNKTELEEILEDTEDVENTLINKIIVEQLLNQLTERDKTIVYLYFYEDLSQCDIAKVVNLEQVSVSRIIRRSLNKMKKQLTA